MKKTKKKIKASAKKAAAHPRKPQAVKPEGRTNSSLSAELAEIKANQRICNELLAKLLDAVSPVAAAFAKGGVAVKSGKPRKGLKGPKTPTMERQFNRFERYMSKNHKNHDDSKSPYGPATSYWHMNQKDFDRAARRSGNGRGYGSHKALADAYRNKKKALSASAGTGDAS